KRRVPMKNVILLDLPTGDDISRKDYEAKIVGPVREALRDRKDKIKIVLCIYGVPLRVGGKEPNQQEKAELAPIAAELKKTQDVAKELDAPVKQLDAEAKKEPKSDAVQDLTRTQSALTMARSESRGLEQRRNWLSYAESHAAVDNELMLLWWDSYELRR